jgi:four helix bundle protein
MVVTVSSRPGSYEPSFSFQFSHVLRSDFGAFRNAEIRKLHDRELKTERRQKQGESMSSSFSERRPIFGSGVYKLLAAVRRSPASRDIIDQLIRSGASIGANANEARGAESRADFIHKMGIALKEARETGYWLAFVELTGIASDPLLIGLRKECDELIAILVKSVTTAKRNAAKTNPNGPEL